jgi:hypothetical protein
MTFHEARLIAEFNDEPKRGGLRYLDNYLRTIAMLEEAGLPERMLGAGTVNYFLTVEKKSPEDTVRVIMGHRCYNDRIASQPRRES